MQCMCGEWFEQTNFETDITGADILCPSCVESTRDYKETQDLPYEDDPELSQDYNLEETYYGEDPQEY